VTQSVRETVETVLLTPARATPTKTAEQVEAEKEQCRNDFFNCYMTGWLKGITFRACSNAHRVCLRAAEDLGVLP